VPKTKHTTVCFVFEFDLSKNDKNILTNTKIYATLCLTKANGGIGMKQKNITHILSKIIIDILIIVGVICVVTVPFWEKLNDKWLFTMVLLMVTGAVGVYILITLRGMYKTLISGNPFVQSNVKAFRRMAVSCLIIALCYIVKCFVVFSLGTVVVVVVFVIASLFCMTLKDLFGEAVECREENDWRV